ncbi:uncharacterized protein LOC107305273 [Oryza brachyantha]|uniref:Uncharacterized protein n=1 Tax=Oryza brachyantha TaxID=4533 RepID=J3N845_ORYBR|nr:uncharacterized protein LOC107305273 [Oryza brachyantha]
MQFMKPLLLAVAVVVVAAAAVDAGVGGSGVGVFKAAEVQTLTLPLRRVADVEDVVSFVEEEEQAAAYPRRRVLYDARYASYNGLAENKAACYGSCPGRGQPYSGRGCQSIYQCNGG